MNRVFGATRETRVSQKVVLKILFAVIEIFKKLWISLYSPYARYLPRFLPRVYFDLIMI